jgi:histidinol phosphatase-like PHP family hydrolase
VLALGVFPWTVRAKANFCIANIPVSLPIIAKRPPGLLQNDDIAELLAREADSAKLPASKALRKAARQAFLWPEEAADLVERGGKLTELDRVGPYIERLIRTWIDQEVSVPEKPPIRSGFFTVPQAAKTIAQKPAWLKAIKGDLQMHTVWSDGEGSIKDMVDAALQRKYSYIAITDHSKGLKIAGGIDESKLRGQSREIESLNDSLGGRFHILRSIELNINPTGEGDMDSKALSQLDLVLGCFHSSLRKTDDQTERYLAALRNPDIQILGHPRGRIYNFRLGLTADWHKVFALAAKLDKAVEIDSYPDRQDLSLDLVKIAKKEGCRISLGTDSHGPSQLRFMAFGAASLIKAGISRDRILNFMDASELLAWVKSVREKPGARR